MARIRFSTKKCFYLPTWEPSASTSASGLRRDDAIASISGEPRVAVQVVSLILPGVRWAGRFSLRTVASPRWSFGAAGLCRQLAPFGWSEYPAGILDPTVLPRSIALSPTVPYEKLTAWLSRTRQGHEKLGKVVPGQVIRQTPRPEAFRRGRHRACRIEDGFPVGRRERSSVSCWCLDSCSPRKMGPTCPPPPHGPTSRCPAWACSHLQASAS